MLVILTGGPRGFCSAYAAEEDFLFPTCSCIRPIMAEEKRDLWG
jgi:hypothetical protein